MKVVIIGAGIAGLGAAVALSRRSHDVHVYEGDVAGAPEHPEDMWARWPRPGTPQARHLHQFLARARCLLRDHAADVLEALLAAGAIERNLGAQVPGGVIEPGDEDFVALRCRRPVFEGVLRRAAETEPRVSIHAGQVVDGLLTAPSELEGVPRVIGVRLRSGGAVPADVVVDASGRRSAVLSWLKAIGARSSAEQAEESGILYYNRYFALRPGTEVPDGGIRVRENLGYLIVILVEGDKRTFVANFAVPTWDRELKVLHREQVFMAAMRSVPSAALWLDLERSTPIGDVQAMGSLRNVLRRFVVDGRPVALGLHVIGDALCHTNPANGAGASIALDHAFTLADVLNEAPNDLLAQALAFDARTADELHSRYKLAVGIDRARTRAWRGEVDPVADPDEEFAVFLQSVLQPAAAVDPVVFRAVTRHVELVDPARSLERNTEVLERARAVAATRQQDGSPPPRGPSRDELLSLAATLK